MCKQPSSKVDTLCEALIEAMEKLDEQRYKKMGVYMKGVVRKWVGC